MGRPIVKYRDTAVSCAKTAVAIEMSFRLRTRVGSKNHVLDGGLGPPGKRHFLGMLAPIVKYRDCLP